MRSTYLAAAVYASLLSANAMAAGVEDADPKVDESKTIIVTGTPIKDYSASDALTATRFAVPLEDLPLSVAVVPHELIEDRGIIQLGEALDNVSGAQRKQGYGGTQNFGAYIRGFDQGFLTLRNGLRDFGFYSLRDIANVERFEVLKGPSSILYGQVQPGGITNTVTKQPTLTPIGRVRATVGSFDRYRAETDLGGPIAGPIYYRLNAAYENYGSFRDGVTNESIFVAPVVSLISGGTRLTFEGEYKNSDFVWDLGLPRNPLSFTVPVSRFLGEPDALNKVESLFGSVRLDQELGNDWRLRVVGAISRSDGDYALRSPLAIGANGRTVSRVAYDTDEFSRTTNFQADLTGAFATGPLRHKLTFGVDYFRTVTAYDFLLQPLASIDLLAPVYGAQPGVGFRLFADRLTTRSTGAFVQDLIEVGDRVHLLLGVRYDKFNYTNTNLLNGALVRDANDDAWTPQAGLLVDVTNTTGAYFSYGKSYLPVTSGRAADGSFLLPETGTQYEAGIKQSLLGGRARLNVAAYQITKQNVSTPDTANPMFRVQTGEQRSRGIELDLTGELSRGWDVILAASYIDAEVTRDNRFALGSKLPGAPELSASLWTKYEFSDALKGLTVGGGVYYVDERQAALPNNNWVLPDYVRVDALVAYDFGPVGLQLNLRNLTNRRIYDLTGVSMIPQEPRAFSLRATYRF